MIESFLPWLGHIKIKWIVIMEMVNIGFGWIIPIQNFIDF